MPQERTEELYEQAAGLLAQAINKIAKTKSKVVLGIVGGRSVEGIFAYLKDMDVNWVKLCIFMIDERMVSLDNSDSNFKLAKDSFIDDLLNKGMIAGDNIHPFRIDYGIDKYKEELEENGGAYDIMLLSAGEDGHIGALYPNHHSVFSEEDYFLTMNDSPKDPPDRMTASKKLMLRSQVAILMMIGQAKQEACDKFFDDSINIEDCPAKLVRELPEYHLLTNLK